MAVKNLHSFPDNGDYLANQIGHWNTFFCGDDKGMKRKVGWGVTAAGERQHSRSGGGGGGPMNLPEFCVKRPIFISMVSCIVMILGGVALSYLPINLMPDITYPSVTIVTTYEDASPEEVEELISKKIESSLSAVSGVKEIFSTSGEGSSNVMVSFNWGTNLDAAVSDVRDRLDRVVPRLPDDADEPILYKFDSASSPIVQIGVATEIDLMDARQLIEDQIQYRIERIDGVASVNIGGGLEREIQVLFDVDKARKLDTSLSNVLSVLENANVTTPAGNLIEGRLEIRVRTPGIFTSIEQISNTVIATGKDGEKIRLRDVAEVIDTHSKINRHVRVNGKPGIMLQVYKQSGANTVRVAGEVLKEIERINGEYSNQILLQPIINSADYIERSIAGVADSAVTGGLLAVVVLFLFLRNLGSTVVIGISIPMSIIATFALVYFCGYTLNIMTLGGLALGVGMLVDNSIVVLENITRLRDSGMPPDEAAVKGTSEVAIAITASTLTTLAVFLPLLFMEGMSGVMFKQFSAVVAFSLGCSLFTAITLVPMMAAKCLGRSVSIDRGDLTFLQRLLASTEYFQRWLERIYGSALDTVLRFRGLFIGILVLLVAASFLLIPLIGSELMPKADEGGGPDLSGNGGRHQSRRGQRHRDSDRIDHPRSGRRRYDRLGLLRRKIELARLRRTQGELQHPPEVAQPAGPFRPEDCGTSRSAAQRNSRYRVPGACRSGAFFADDGSRHRGGGRRRAARL